MAALDRYRLIYRGAPVAPKNPPQVGATSRNLGQETQVVAVELRIDCTSAEYGF